MINNPVIEAMLSRKSIRKYKAEMPSDEVIETVARAGQQAPFAFQYGSLLLTKDLKKNPFKAPLLFTICVDSHRMEAVMERRGWQIAMNDLSLLIFGIQDASLMAENMVVAAESLGMGSCFLGGAPYQAKNIIKKYKLPKRVFPLVQLVMGYPAENPPTRPRYPLDFFLFEDRYPEFTDEMVQDAMRRMDEGYLAQDYYRRAKYQIPLEDGREEAYNFKNYSWTEHISRKVGQWMPSSKEILAQLKACGFQLGEED
jgi:nitroreductase